MVRVDLLVLAGHSSLVNHHLYPLSLGESEYWFAMIKIIMIIVFIFVGLIYDWGGVRGHLGPVSSFRLSHSALPPPYVTIQGSNLL